MRILKQARLITLAILCGTVVSSCNYSDIASADRLVGWAIYAIDHTDMANIPGLPNASGEAQFPDAQYEPQNRTKLYLPSESSTDFDVCFQATTASSGTLSWDQSVEFVAWVKEAEKRELGLKKCEALLTV